MDDLYYIDIANHVRQTEYSRDKMLSVSPIFFTSKRTALIAAKDRIESDVQRGFNRIREIEKELAGDPR